MLVYKGYQIKPHKQLPSHLIVVTDGKGGKIPDVLSGMFTSYNVAKQLIDEYLVGKNKDAEAVTESRV
jgi:hypothetical protein